MTLTKMLYRHRHSSTNIRTYLKRTSQQANRHEQPKSTWIILSILFSLCSLYECTYFLHFFYYVVYARPYRRRRRRTSSPPPPKGAGCRQPTPSYSRRPYTCYRTYQNPRSCGALERLRRMSVTYYRHLVQTSARPSNDRHNKRTHTEEQTNQKVHGLF